MTTKASRVETHTKIMLQGKVRPNGVRHISIASMAMLQRVKSPFVAGLGSMDAEEIKQLSQSLDDILIFAWIHGADADTVRKIVTYSADPPAAALDAALEWGGTLSMDKLETYISAIVEDSEAIGAAATEPVPEPGKGGKATKSKNA